MIVLASASPRRRELLEAAGLDFVVRASAADEALAPGVLASDGARILAERKARAVFDAGVEGRWFVGADTIVVLGEGGGGEELLGKPAGPAEARGMLARLSGSRHRVITGVSVLAADGRVALGVETTRVHMRTIQSDEIEAYVTSGEWRDKAGGYAIQESADRFVTELAGGGFDNVVGLPVALTLELLKELGAPVPGIAPPGGGR